MRDWSWTDVLSSCIRRRSFRSLRVFAVEAFTIRTASFAVPGARAVAFFAKAHSAVAAGLFSLGSVYGVPLFSFEAVAAKSSVVILAIGTLAFDATSDAFAETGAVEF